MALVLEPSRELAEQTHRVIGQFAKYLPFPPVRTALLIGKLCCARGNVPIRAGGVDAKAQIAALKQGRVCCGWGVAHAAGVDVVVGTPGRIEDMVKTDKLDLSAVSWNVCGALA